MMNVGCLNNSLSLPVHHFFFFFFCSFFFFFCFAVNWFSPFYLLSLNLSLSHSLSLFYTHANYFFQVVENFNMFLMTAQSLGCNVRSYDASQMSRGPEASFLDLLWQVMRVSWQRSVCVFTYFFFEKRNIIYKYLLWFPC